MREIPNDHKKSVVKFSRKGAKDTQSTQSSCRFLNGIMIWVLLLLPATAFGQVDSFRNSIGFFGETNALFTGYGEPIMKTFALQYIRKSKKVLQYKVGIGYGGYEQPPYALMDSIYGDTAESRSVIKYIDLGIISLGVEAQRQFYRKLHFFGGIELRAGYGNGTTETSIIKEYNVVYNIPPYRWHETGVDFSYSRGPNVTMTYVGFTPYFGLKLEFKRITLGTSFMSYVYYTKIKKEPKGYADNSVEFDGGNITQQLFVRYKF
ncbi:MAG: hypothetical protein K0Q79_1048 [Flavipsychrobacter sp.]|jgi:hypothetical protein|nr:hypothetical protein [Flavipsychrobacter sp.]